MTIRNAGMTIGSALVRAVAAVASGLVLAFGVALVLWAITPSADDQSAAFAGAAIVFATAHFMPITLGATALTIHPLLATALLLAAVTTAAGRGAAVRGRRLEALHAGMFVVVYALGAFLAVRMTAPAGAVDDTLLPPLIIAALGALLSLAWHTSAWRTWWRDVTATWLHVGLRAAMAAVMMLLAAGALVLTVALVAAFPRVIGVAEMTVDSPGAALGMTLICLALIPNAAVAAIGYAAGPGFDLGGAHFSPFGVHTVDLPGIPLLAAAPSADPGLSSWLVFAVPIAAGLVAAVVILRAVTTRLDRLLASACAGVVAGLITVGLVAAAGGGVAGGPWATSGADAWATGAVVAAVTALIPAIFTMLLRANDGWGALTSPWDMTRHRRGHQGRGRASGRDRRGDHDGSTPDETPAMAGAGD